MYLLLSLFNQKKKKKIHSILPPYSHFFFLLLLLPVVIVAAWLTKERSDQTFTVCWTRNHLRKSDRTHVVTVNYSVSFFPFKNSKIHKMPLHYLKKKKNFHISSRGTRFQKSWNTEKGKQFRKNLHFHDQNSSMIESDENATKFGSQFGCKIKIVIAASSNQQLEEDPAHKRPVVCFRFWNFISVIFCFMLGTNIKKILERATYDVRAGGHSTTHRHTPKKCERK